MYSLVEYNSCPSVPKISRIVQLGPTQKYWRENAVGGLPTRILDQMIYKFTGINEKPYDQKRERKSKPIIIIIANYKNPNPKKDQPGIKRCLKKINNLT